MQSIPRARGSVQPEEATMHHRRLGRTGLDVSEIGFGTWAIGGSWGPVDDDTSLAALRRAADTGVTFVDTADVYGDGRSERLVGSLLNDYPRLVVATKAGRRLDPHTTDGYTAENLERFVDRSLRNLGVDAIDLLQLHCPPTDVYYRPEVFAALDDLVRRGEILHYGVSVERVEEALKAIEFPGVETVQIIFNIFRQRPTEVFFPEAARHNVGVIVRVPLASGLLTGKFGPETRFPEGDHRRFNRHGEQFDVGETFAGVPYEVGLAAVDELRALVPSGVTMAQFALRWVLMFPAVSTVIAGAKTPAQAFDNASASAVPPLSADTMHKVRDVYERLVKRHVHQRW
jgi:aryl-alcohol dehydrogenase-like predicted oxidoreductase